MTARIIEQPDYTGEGGHTPGPWHASEMGADRSFWDALAADDVQIVRTNWDGFTGDVIAAVWADDDHDEAANARLIAAAPDSHEANVEAADFLLAAFAQMGNPDGPEGWDDPDAYAVYAKLRSAIAKAQGSKP